MRQFTVNVHAHKTLAVLATITVNAWGATDAQHAAIRAAMAQGHSWDQNGGLFARISAA